MDVDPSAPTEDETNKTIQEIQEEFMVGLLISSTDQKRFVGLKRELHKSYFKGLDEYPKTFKATKRLFATCKVDQSNVYARAHLKKDGVVFL